MVPFAMLRTAETSHVEEVQETFRFTKLCVMSTSRRNNVAIPFAIEHEISLLKSERHDVEVL